MKNELQNIISGKNKVSAGARIQEAACYLRESTETSTVAKEAKYFKKQEEEILKKYITANNLWIFDVDIEKYVSEGAEQKVYLKDERTVSKLNDAIFFNSWEDYLNNLLLHNYFFPTTAYTLEGFYLEKEKLFAVVTQLYINATQLTDLQAVKDFMLANGFINTRNNDYHHPGLGIILEDLHDENVLTENGVLQFIDTVFYIQDKFYEE